MCSVSGLSFNEHLVYFETCIPELRRKMSPKSYIDGRRAHDDCVLSFFKGGTKTVYRPVDELYNLVMPLNIYL